LEKQSGRELIIIPSIPSELRDKLRGSTNVWVQRVDEHIVLLNTLIRDLPKAYKWKFRTVEGFTTQVEELARSASDMFPINQLVWRDHLGSCQAYSLMTTWRIVELARGCVWAIARGEVIASALLARSALETAVQLVDMARRVSATLAGAGPEDRGGRLLDPKLDLNSMLTASQDFEDLILKTLFGTRLPESDEFYKAKNVLSLIQAATRIAGQEKLLPMYETLCEVAHPNFIGRSIYILDRLPTGRVGEEIRVIGPGLGPSAGAIVETVIGGLSWACGTNVSAFDLMAETMKAVATRLSLG
jgi:hypothetical protein